MDPNVVPISPQQTEKLDSYTGLNKKVVFKDKHTGKRFVVGKIVDEVSVLSFNYKYVYQKIELAPDMTWDGSRYAYRDGYYTWDAKMVKVVWGQFHALPSEKEKRGLLKSAYSRGWFPGLM